MAEVAVADKKTDAKRDASGRWLPGMAPRGAGRPKGSRDAGGLLNDALKLVEKGRAARNEPCTCTLKYGQTIPCKTLDEHFVRLAFFDPMILPPVQRKRLPDLQHQTGDAKPVAINIQYGHQAPRVQVVQPLEGNGHNP